MRFISRVDSNSTMDSGYSLRKNTPPQKSGVVSQLFFTYFIQLLSECLKKNNNLKVEDLRETAKSNSSQILGERMEKEWDTEMAKAEKCGRKPSLVRALISVLGRPFLVQGLLLFVQCSIFRSLRPFIVYKLLNEFENGADTQELFLAVFYLTFVSLVILILYHNVNNELSLIGMRGRLAISSLINRKLLRLRRESFGHTTTGQIINLLTNDAQRLQVCSRAIHFLWITPLQFVFVILSLWLKLGWSSTLGVVIVILVVVPFYLYCGKKTKQFRDAMAKTTDSRLKLFAEVVDSIFLIKVQSWEDTFEKLIARTRRAEIESLKYSDRIRAVLLSSVVSVESVLLFVGIVSYAAVRSPISADLVYFLAQTCHICYLTINLYLLLSIFETSECVSVIERVQTFLLLDEKTSANPTVIGRKLALNNVVYRSGSGSGSGGAKKSLSFEIEAGSFCAIIGPVGSGKSTLLHLLMSELEAVSGSVTVPGRFSYASQQSWLFPSTVRNNILFGEKFDPLLYEKVLETCALKKDIDHLPDKDEHVIGGKSSSLSGGQRSRINLARAVYRKAELYLLDDPLASVDCKTAAHIFKKCFLRFLAGKTRLMVTHSTHFLRSVDVVLMLENGAVTDKGTYEELRSRNARFARMVTDSEERLKEDLIAAQTETVSKELAPAAQKKKHLDDAQTVQEMSVFKTISKIFVYFGFSGHRLQLFLITALYVCINSTVLIIDIFVAKWLEFQKSDKINIQLTQENSTTFNSSFWSSDNNYNEYKYDVESGGFREFLLNNMFPVYGSFVLFLLVFTTLWSWLYFRVTQTASLKLHERMAKSVLRADLAFFRSNPTGEIFNRFSKDLGTVDEGLPKAIALYLQGLLFVVGTTAIIALINYYLVVISILFIAAFLLFQSYMISVTRKIKTLEAMSKTPVIAHVDTTVAGLTTIRASRMETQLTTEFHHHQDVNTAASHALITCNSFFALWLDMTLLTLQTVTICVLIYAKNDLSITVSTLGLIVIRMIALLGMLQNSAKEGAESFGYLANFERLHEYTHLKEESFGNDRKDAEALKNWPKGGEIIFDNVSMSSNSILILKNINLRISAGEKIGIVGRTGAGKTSLLNMLLRLYPTMGGIYVDGLNVETVDLSTLRTRISIIPQTPVLFTGTMRFNLDPHQTHSDSLIWKSLAKVHLLESIKSLDMSIDASNNQFSVGQKQLLSIARAIVQNNKILLLDEATANIDPQTDALIRETIYREFASCTVIAVAHHIKSIIDSDRIIVLDQGKIQECDQPGKLLENPSSHFHKLVKEIGPNAIKKLTNKKTRL